MTGEQNLIFVATKIPKEIHRALRVGAAENDLPLKDYIRKVLEVHNDLETLFEWAWQYIEKSDSGNADYLEALEAHGPIDAWKRLNNVEDEEDE